MRRLQAQRTSRSRWCDDDDDDDVDDDGAWCVRWSGCCCYGGDDAAAVGMKFSLFTRCMYTRHTEEGGGADRERRGGGGRGRGGEGDKKGGGAGGSSLKNLHAIVEGVSHDDTPVAVDGDAATRAVELSVA
jgi:hypothetical protein